MNSSKRYYLFLITFLGMLSAFGPFVTDMYLPALPSMAGIFNTTPSAVQAGLAASLIGLAAGQIFFGPLSDKYGRRPILVAAMILFAASTVAAIYSPTIEFFNVCRLLQGLGGAGGIVLSRSIATDCYSGRELAKTLAIIGAVNGIAPVTAPVVGGLVAESVGWQGIFWILLGIGLALLAMCMVFRESLADADRHKGPVGQVLKAFPLLLRRRRFMLYVVLFALANVVLFAYISSASFIIQQYFGFSEMMFAAIFGVNALAIGIGSGLSLRCATMQRAALIGAGGATAASACQLAVYGAGMMTFALFEAMTFMALLFTGYIFTAATTLAMDEGRTLSGGAASAIFGAAGFLFGGMVAPATGIGDIMPTTLSLMTAGATGALVLAIAATIRRHRVSAA